MKEDHKKTKEPEKNIRGLTLGFNMAAGMAFFTYLGYLADQKLGKHILTLVGMFMGLFYCGYEVWKLIRKNGDGL